MIEPSALLGYSYRKLVTADVLKTSSTRYSTVADSPQGPRAQSFYFLDEPKTGLHFDDVKKLLSVLRRLVDAGNSVLVIEHNLDVIKPAEWVLDLGQDGGSSEGNAPACGAPEKVTRVKGSVTGKYLNILLLKSI